MKDILKIEDRNKASILSLVSIQYQYQRQYRYYGYLDWSVHLYSLSSLFVSPVLVSSSSHLYTVFSLHSLPLSPARRCRQAPAVQWFSRMQAERGFLIPRLSVRQSASSLTPHLLLGVLLTHKLNKKPHMHTHEHMPHRVKTLCRHLTTLGCGYVCIYAFIIGMYSYINAQVFVCAVWPYFPYLLCVREKKTCDISWHLSCNNS